MRPGAARRRPWLALFATLFIQTLTAVSQGVPAVLAPVIAPAVDLPADRIGIFTGIIYVFAMLSGLASSRYIAVTGPLKMSLLALLLCGTGLAFLAVPNVVVLIASAVLIGAGYGIANPTAAQILGKHSPPDRRGLFFSLKQSGVPLGIAIAGVLAPWLYLKLGWQGAVIAIGLGFGLAAIALLPISARFDSDSTTESTAQRGLSKNLFAPLIAILRDSNLRQLGLVSLAYAAMQVCLIAFLVVYLHLEHGLSLPAAAAILAAAQFASILGRPFWGWVADWSGQPARLLGGLGVAMGVACLTLALLPTPSPVGMIYIVCMACAGTAIAWNGVFYAELVRRAPADRLATVTGGTQFMTFAGGMSGPIVFGWFVSQTNQYWLAFALLSALPIAAGLHLLLRAGYSSPGTP